MAINRNFSLLLLGVFLLAVVYAAPIGDGNNNSNGGDGDANDNDSATGGGKRKLRKVTSLNGTDVVDWDYEEEVEIGKHIEQAQNISDKGPTRSHWNYDNFTAWGAINPVCNNGKRQSPIDIVKSTVVFDQKLADDQLTFVGYSTLGKQLLGEFLNNGHTVQFSINSTVENKDRPQIKGGGLGNNYILEQFHFHWGNSSQGKAACQGAEHTIDGRSAPVEVHFVHFNAKYENLANATRFEDGGAVIGFLFEPVTDKNLIKNDYAPIIKLVSSVADAGKKVGTVVDISNLIPTEATKKESATYYRYDGSLTTPPCIEIVTWTVFEYRIPILTTTIDELKKAYLAAEEDHSDDHHASSPVPIVNNFRPPQPLAGRVVKCNSQNVKSLAGNTNASKGQGGIASAVVVQKWLLIVAAAIAAITGLLL